MLNHFDLQMILFVGIRRIWKTFNCDLQLKASITYTPHVK